MLGFLLGLFFGVLTMRFIYDKKIEKLEEKEEIIDEDSYKDFFSN
ncbi:MAG: hypothetical protein PHU05_02305 [Bacilli bacterium]|nr:hypothetical protein [Bacilli bacterium]